MLHQEPDRMLQDLSLSRRKLLTFLAGISAILPSLSRSAKSQTLPSQSVITENVPTNFSNMPQTSPFAPSLLVAGPSDSSAARWANWINRGLSQGLGQNDPLHITYTVGRDGVTGANQFDTRTNPDGSTALLASGVTFLTSLGGDPRVHFDYGRWISCFASFSEGVVIGNAPLHHTRFDLLKNNPIKVAVSTPIGLELPMILGFHLLRRIPIPITGLVNASAAVYALKTGQVDAIQLSGPDVTNYLSDLKRDGFPVLFSLSEESKNGHPSFASQYTKILQSLPSSLLCQAWSTLAMAARLDGCLMLPMLTPAALVSKWRNASNVSLSNTELRQNASSLGLSLFSAPESAVELRKILPSPAALLALRRWSSWKSANWR